MEIHFTNLQFVDFILLALLILSLYFDLTQKKIPNFLTFPVMLWGLLSYTISGGLKGFLFSFYGLLFGIAIFLIPFILGGMGGGDVKLLSAIGAIKGMEFVVYATIFTAVAGALIAIIVLIMNKQLLKTMIRILSKVAVPVFTKLYYIMGLSFLNTLVVFFSSYLEKHEYVSKLSFPYAVAIALGTFLVWSTLGFKAIPIYNIL